VLKVDRNLADNVLHITPQEKIHWGKYGDLWGQAIDPLLPIYLPAISVMVIPNRVGEIWRRMCVSLAWKKKTYRGFLSDDINRIRVWQLLSEIPIFYFGHSVFLLRMFTEMWSLRKIRPNLGGVLKQIFLTENNTIVESSLFLGFGNSITF
jgi:hypothetical protein